MLPERAPRHRPARRSARRPRAPRPASACPTRRPSPPATTLTSTGAVDSFHDSYTALGGGDADAQHDARRGRARRHRLGPVRHPGPRGHHGVRRRADGRPDAGVPGEEDRRPGDQVRLAVLPDHADARAGRHRRSRWPCPGSGPAMLNTGPHGLSEVLYAFTSAANNNGSAFAGHHASTPTWYNTALGLAMLLGRFLPIVFVLGLAGSLARQKPVPASDGHAADPPAAVRRHARRRDPHPRRAHLPPGARARPARGRAALMTTPRLVDSPPTAQPAAPSAPSRRAGSAAGCSTRSSCWRSLPDALRKLNPRTLWRNPVMFIVEIGAVFTTVLAIADPTRVRLADHGLAVADRASSPTWPRRSPRAAARRRPRRCAGPRQDTMARRLAGWQRRAPTERRARRRCRRRSCGRATSSSSRPARSSPATATSSRASPASTSRRSPASPRR